MNITVFGITMPHQEFVNTCAEKTFTGYFKRMFSLNPEAGFSESELKKIRDYINAFVDWPSSSIKYEHLFNLGFHEKAKTFILRKMRKGIILSSQENLFMCEVFQTHTRRY